MFSNAPHSQRSTIKYRPVSRSMPIYANMCNAKVCAVYILIVFVLRLAWWHQRAVRLVNRCLLWHICISMACVSPVCYTHSPLKCASAHICALSVRRDIHNIKSGARLIGVHRRRAHKLTARPPPSSSLPIKRSAHPARANGRTCSARLRFRTLL